MTFHNVDGLIDDMVDIMGDDLDDGLVDGLVDGETKVKRMGAYSIMDFSRMFYNGFTWMASTANRRICTVAPDAYQKGPEIPTRHPMFEDISSVAAQVH